MDVEILVMTFLKKKKTKACVCNGNARKPETYPKFLDSTKDIKYLA